MSEQRETASSNSTTPALRAALLGAAVAVALGALVRFASALDALQWVAAALLLSAGARLLTLRRASAPGSHASAARASDARLLAAGCSAGAMLWLLAPWSQAAPGAVAELSRATSASERSWLCASSLLATPYVLPRGRVLLAADSRHASLLHACALRRARGGVDLAPPHPLARAVPAARARARTATPRRHDLVLVAVQPPAHPLPLGPLPWADAPLETREGVRDLFALLAPDGVLAATMLGEPAALRWIHTARGALRDMGASALERHFVVYAAAGAYTVLARAAPFDTDSVLAFHEARHDPAVPAPASLQRWPAWLRTRPELQATPGSAFDTRVAAEVRAKDDVLQPAEYVFDLRATSDDRPLFYESTRVDRLDTWSPHTSYWVLGWSCALALLFALVLAVLAARAPAARELGGGRAALIIGYGGLAIGHALVLTFAQQRVAIWSLRPLDAPALSVLVLAGGGGALLALMRSPGRASVRRMPRALAFALCAPAPALLIAFASTSTPAPELAVQWGQARLAWLALGGLIALGAACALGIHAWSACTTPATQRAAVVTYVGALAPGVLLGPSLVSISGYRSCALCASVALALAMLATLLRPPMDRS